MKITKISESDILIKEKVLHISEFSIVNQALVKTEL